MELLGYHDSKAWHIPLAQTVELDGQAGYDCGGLMATRTGFIVTAATMELLSYHDSKAWHVPLAQMVKLGMTVEVRWE
eukprot:gene14142-20105_t